MTLFQTLALGPQYFSQLNPDFVLEVAKELFTFAPTEVCRRYRLLDPS